MEKKHFEVALKALYSRERALQNSFHSMYRTLENAKSFPQLKINIEKILERIDKRQAELLETTTAIHYLEVHLEELETEE